MLIDSQPRKNVIFLLQFIYNIKFYLSIHVRCKTQNKFPCRKLKVFKYNREKSAK